MSVYNDPDANVTTRTSNFITFTEPDGKHSCLQVIFCLLHSCDVNVAKAMAACAGGGEM